MSLGTNSRRTWVEMKEAFLGKYRDYYIPSNLKDEVFKMTQKEDENLEDLVERFVYNIKREKMDNLDQETLKAPLLKAIKDEWINLLNLTGKGDIPQLPFADICDLCVYISRGKSRVGQSPRDPLLSRIHKSAAVAVNGAELGNLLDTFKKDILGSLSEHIYTLKIQNKQKSEKCYIIYFLSQMSKEACLKRVSLRFKSYRNLCHMCK